MNHAAIFQLYKLLEQVDELNKYYDEQLPEKDIRIIHFKMFQSQVNTSYIDLKINFFFSENNNEQFLNLFSKNTDIAIDNAKKYVDNLTQNTNQILIETILFQTELVFRYYYSLIKDITPGEEKNINKIIATLFDDSENNWKKEECKLLILLWSLRNTIHTGGIYFKNKEGRKIEYKNKEYVFEYGKSTKFLTNNFSIQLISDLLKALKLLFESDKIKDLGYIEHPCYYALL